MSNNDLILLALHPDVILQKHLGDLLEAQF